MTVTFRQHIGKVNDKIWIGFKREFSVWDKEHVSYVKNIDYISIFN